MRARAALAGSCAGLMGACARLMGGFAALGPVCAALGLFHVLQKAEHSAVRVACAFLGMKQRRLTMGREPPKILLAALAGRLAKLFCHPATLAADSASLKRLSASLAGGHAMPVVKHSRPATARAFLALKPVGLALCSLRPPAGFAVPAPAFPAVRSPLSTAFSPHALLRAGSCLPVLPALPAARSIQNPLTPSALRPPGPAPFCCRHACAGC